MPSQRGGYYVVDNGGVELTSGRVPVSSHVLTAKTITSSIAWGTIHESGLAYCIIYHVYSQRPWLVLSWGEGHYGT